MLILRHESLLSVVQCIIDSNVNIRCGSLLSVIQCIIDSNVNIKA